MGLFKNLKPANMFMLGLCVAIIVVAADDDVMLVLCLVIIIVAEYLFLKGDHLHGLFIGLWAPTLLGVMIYLKLHENGSK